MRRLIVVGLLAFAVALTGTAYAEVQNIKVSGDIDMKGIAHHNYDLKEKNRNFSHPESAGVGTTVVTNDDDEMFYLSTVNVQVDADLTDNVSTSVRLMNQRKWDNGSGTQDDVHLENAYVTLKEFLYSPLTIIAGRQNLNYGTGFIVGNNGRLQDPEVVFPATDSASLQPNGREYSAFNSFDAIRAILDFAPLTVEGLVSKNNETGVLTNDEDLYGLIVNYKLDRWNAEIEPYWFYLNDESGARTITVNDASVSNAGTIARVYEINRVHTVGLRAAAAPIENLKLNGEVAHQFGEMIDSNPVAVGPNRQKRDRSAWGANVYANYTWAQVPWTPSTGVGGVFFSGEQVATEDVTLNGVGEGGSGDDKFNAWDSIYRDQHTTFIEDFLGGQDASANLYTTLDRNDTSAATNRRYLFLDASAKPIQDVTLWARYTRSWFDIAPRPGRDKHAGDEVDAKLLYDYTEDVQLSAFGGWFIPGKYYDGESNSIVRSNDMAWTAGAGAKVKF